MSISAFLVAQTVRFPLLFANLIGLILAIVRYQQAPKAMMRIAIGCGLMMLSSMSWMALFYLINVQSSAQARQNLSLLSSLIPLLQVVGLSILLAGAFSSRRTEERGFPVEMRAR